VKQAGPYFAARSIEIRKGIEDAKSLRADAEARAAAMEARLTNLGVEVEAMRKAARDEAAQEGARIRKETERELAKIQVHADHEISSALKAAQVELKSYSAQLAVELARKKVRERMTPADEDSLVRNFVADLGGKLEQGTTR
jgi:F-type H+-transporting ATPase subunit b